MLLRPVYLSPLHQNHSDPREGGGTRLSPELCARSGRRSSVALAVGRLRALEHPCSELGLALLVLAVLADCAVAQGDAHSLQYVFNISFNEQQRCVVQVFMDRTLILKYDCYNKYVIHEKQEIKTTNVSEDMKNTLKSVGDEMRWRLLDLKNRKICRDSSILEVWLKCQIDAIGSCSGLWEFHLDGQRFLVFYPENGEYEVHNSSGEEMKKTWESDKEVNELLKKIAMGDCKRWLQVLDWEKVLGTTAAQAMAAASASPTTATATSKAKANTAWIIPLSCICLILLAFGFWYIYNNRRRCSGAPVSGSSSTCIPSGRPPSHHTQVLTCDPLELQPISAANGETSRRS